MKNWKKNAVVASILVFVCAGIYLNWMYTQDQETANLTDTLNEEKILGSSTLVMSQTGSLAADAAKEDLQAASGQTNDYFAAVKEYAPQAVQVCEYAAINQYAMVTESLAKLEEAVK